VIPTIYRLAVDDLKQRREGSKNLKQ